MMDAVWDVQFFSLIIAQNDISEQIHVNLTQCQWM